MLNVTTPLAVLPIKVPESTVPDTVPCADNDKVMPNGPLFTFVTAPVWSVTVTVTENGLVLTDGYVNFTVLVKEIVRTLWVTVTETALVTAEEAEEITKVPAPAIAK